MGKGKNKLRAGKGAIALVLTRFIKPPQPLPGGDKKHQSMVVLEEQAQDADKKKIFRFYYDGDESEDKTLMWANHRYLKVVKEGNHLLLFGGPGAARPPETTEPRIKWRFSKARRLLVEDINNGVIEFDDDNNPFKYDDDNEPVALSYEEIYAMRPEYADYLLENFEERVLAIWNKVKDDMNRADEDLQALEDFMESNEVSLMNKDGFPEWQGSEAQEQAWVDLAEENIKDYGYRYVFDNNPVYNEYYTYDYFYARIKQEIRTEKYLHTLEIRELQKREKQNKKDKRNQKKK